MFRESLVLAAMKYLQFKTEDRPHKFLFNIQSSSGNLVYILTITSPSRNPEISRSKRAVVITARVHPGETNASWMMKGFLDYLTSSSADAKVGFRLCLFYRFLFV